MFHQTNPKDNPAAYADSSEKLTAPLVVAVMAGALGGLLFGFDTAVISGAQTDLVALFKLTAFEQGFMTASALIGAVIGSLAAAKPGDLWGRRESLKVAAAFYLICAIGCAMAESLWMLVLCRTLGGIAVGASSVLTPLYLAEISPTRWRGRLVACFQVNIVVGVLVAYLSNFAIGRMGLEAAEWRWKLGAQAFPSLLFFVMLFVIPESPRWLVLRRRTQEAAAALKRLGISQIQARIESFANSIGSETSSAPLFTRKLRKPVILAILIAAFNQLGGINALWYYADAIFAAAGFGRDSSAKQAAILGVVNLLSTLFGMAVIDRVGRRPLLLWGALGCGLSLAGASWIIGSGQHAGWLVGFFGLFVICHAFGQGAVIWVFISEIFPTAVRGKGQTLGSFVHWFMAMLISWLFPLFAKEAGQPGAGLPFAFFAGAMVVQIVVIAKYFPETKQIALEDMSAALR